MASFNIYKVLPFSSQAIMVHGEREVGRSPLEDEKDRLAQLADEKYEYIDFLDQKHLGQVLGKDHFLLKMIEDQEEVKINLREANEEYLPTSTECMVLEVCTEKNLTPIAHLVLWNPGFSEFKKRRKKGNINGI